MALYPHRPGVAALALAALLAASAGAQQPAAPAPSAAQPAPLNRADAVQLLTRIQQAARRLDYSGVYAYQQGSRMQASRIVHVIDGTGERERIEVLDGAPREFLRHNDEVQCLLPEQQAVVRETRRGGQFPSLLTGNVARQPARLLAHYQVSVRPGTQRLAGRRCRQVLITPRDALRYGYRLCVDTSTHLLLQTQTLAGDLATGDAVVEQIAFSALQLGRETDFALFASRWSKNQWPVYEYDFKPADLAAHGWLVRPPPGFVTVAQLRRRGWQASSGNHASNNANNNATDGVSGDEHDVLQLLLSDGLATISVFIEPVRPEDGQAHEGHASTHAPAHAQTHAPTHLQGAHRQGATNAWGARIAGHWLIALGEVPVATLKALIESTQYTPPPGLQ